MVKRYQSARRIIGSVLRQKADRAFVIFLFCKIVQFIYDYGSFQVIDKIYIGKHPTPGKSNIVLVLAMLAQDYVNDRMQRTHLLVFEISVRLHGI